MSQVQRNALAAHLLTIPDAAERLNTTERHVRNLVYRREIPYIKVGHLVRIRPDALDAWLNANTVPAEGGAA